MGLLMSSDVCAHEQLISYMHSGHFADGSPEFMLEDSLQDLRLRIRIKF